MKPRGSNPLQGKIELLDFTEQDTKPAMTLHLVGRDGKALETATVDPDGRFELTAARLQQASLVHVGRTKRPPPSAEEIAEGPTYRAADVSRRLTGGDTMKLARKEWLQLVQVRRCVSGSVTHCRLFSWQVAELIQRALPIDVALRPLSAAHPAIPRLPDLALHARCHTVCDGVVEVYRRTCCHRPWIIDDPRIPDVVRDLEELLREWSRGPWPPIPFPPDPDPWLCRSHRTLGPLFKNGALDERLLNAAQDLHALKSLPKFEQAAYIEARPYLWPVSCGAVRRVAAGTIQPGGDFTVCWHEALRRPAVDCHDELAFVVKQVINGEIVTIYDGIAAHAWFHVDDDIRLTSHHPEAVACGEDLGPQGMEGNYVLLQDIGAAQAWRLATPPAANWDRVSPMHYNSGLLDPAPTAQDALGNDRNSNWGGTLALRFKFSDGMKGLDARFYRISVSPADANGSPTGPRRYLDGGVSWYYYELTDASINVGLASLGPTAQQSLTNVYEIPYHADRDWMSGQYHGFLDTTAFPNGRFLLTLEVFNGQGKRLRPSGTSPIGDGCPSAEASFTFRRWETETGSTAEVPYAALTHLLWWDNRNAIGLIEDLRHNGVQSTAECQFIEGCGVDRFSAGYRAYHPEPMFLRRHSLSWKRGLRGGSGSLLPESAPLAPFQNVGQPPLPVGESASADIATMLGGAPKCSFALHLDVEVKTTNGAVRLMHLDAHDTAAFALEEKNCNLRPPLIDVDVPGSAGVLR